MLTSDTSYLYADSPEKCKHWVVCGAIKTFLCLFGASNKHNLATLAQPIRWFRGGTIWPIAERESESAWPCNILATINKSNKISVTQAVAHFNSPNHFKVVLRCYITNISISNNKCCLFEPYSSKYPQNVSWFPQKY